MVRRKQVQPAGGLNITVASAIALLLALFSSAIGIGAFVAGCTQIASREAMGQPATQRIKPPVARAWMAFKAIVSHSSFKGRPGIRAAHWVVMFSFPILFLTLVTGYGQLLNPGFQIPYITDFFLYEWAVEFFAWASFLGISALFIVRVRNGGILPWRKSETQPHPREGSPLSLPQRFFGSTRWQAIFVEAVILGVVLCVIILRALEYARATHFHPQIASLWHFPTTAWIGHFLAYLSPAHIDLAIIIVACLKIIISMTWMAIAGVQTTMGVAWHRFLAVINVFARKNLDGSKALGPLDPIIVNDEPVTAETIDDLPEDARLGVRTITDFTWKGLLDFDTCTECGRCQELCPAWATGKPLSPKLFTLALRDHHASAAQFMRAANQLAAQGQEVETDPVDETPLVPLDKARTGNDCESSSPSFAIDENLPQVAHTGDVLGALMAAGASPDPEYGVALQYTDLVPNVITPDVLWACTTCGACVEQCPVDIEHVDHIVDLRRHQVLLESAFPKELAGVFRKLETKSNPYGQAPRKRLAWAKPLDFEVPVIGVDVEDATEVDYVFWVGCAGAFDDQAQKTSRAVAELLYRAGVKFGVLGQAETCTGDPARRAGNELLFQMLAAGAVETLNEVKATKIVVTCAHCFNAIAREFPQIGGKYEVLHHTQLLNQLVREGKLTPIAPDPADAQKVTFHDPCYLGRHNQIYSPPRELLEASGVEVTEMPRTRERAMCCGGGGARAWIEETEGTRIAAARLTEAAETGAETVATGCPFCTQMLGSAQPLTKEGQTPLQSPQIKDVALLLLESVRRGDKPENEPSTHPKDNQQAINEGEDKPSESDQES
ncbi:(Fe-S)-binding protein [Actinomycetaceae bacterium TAE3-ERU4]|nr:(Fe-S)-binding protein [Actinomycetaceae bacterium TAE3-ERU4]